MNEPLTTARFGSGKNVRRAEDPALVAGRGRFTDDIALPGQVHMVFLRSPYAHARIVSIDVGACLAMPGVSAAYTGAQLVQAGVKTLTQPLPFPRPDGKPGATASRYALAHETVRFVGEAVVAIVADTRETATNAAEAVVIEYEELPCVVDALAAMKPGAPALCPDAPDNIAAQTRHGDAAAVDRAFAVAAHKVSVDIVNQRLAPSPMEPRSVAVEPEAGTDRLVVRLSSQMPTAVRDGLSGALGIDASKVRVLVNDVGGGFGMKTGLYPEDVVVAFAARALKRPVRWNSQRIEEFLASTHGRDQVTHAEMALDASGKVLGLRVRSVANIGAYATETNVVIPLLIGPWVTTSVYDIPAIDLHLTAVMTNTMLIGAYRGAGRPEAIYVTERLMDAAAREMKMDPSELRRRNLIRPDQMPYTNPMQQVYDCGEFEKIMDRTLALADWKGFDARRAQSVASGKLRGRGISTFLEWTGGNALTELVTVNVLPEGIIELTSATQAMGQGIQTSYVQLAVDVFGVPPERIRVLQGDTDAANGFGSAGSRSLFTGGSAVKVASEQTIDHARSLAAAALEAAASDIHYSEGRFTVTGTDVGIDLFALAGKQQDARIRVEASATAGAPSWPNACHICEVEIDPATGVVEIAAYASVNDIGRVVSPAIVRGQVDGGAVQGIGQALSEHVVYDKESGQLLTASFMDYALPRADVFRAFKTEFDTSIPCTTNPLGVKGVGELGTIGATPTVVNAVVDALASAGLGRAAEKVQMPLTGMAVWSALRGEFEAAGLQ
ncbi:xanthine dehydrogenase family protein molybdopterin-binding subunit [Ramlibacter sp. WS9]|uniref:xanthine dehydrogenase family protein molybdopterin-binding subunit n=1 Tax=Ramlibacter sp. WS9 TaxID=1882741 RepID=UPI0011432133|nr:xanthine dehydrogenase family protein molybdopterin-binding subunit [Ramlibacter sp. WS9]ROZ78776.1 xanthine dehydrogenase family protein molybdopterin-binding subunit [Ramlibacter sp. WS9]